MSWRWPGYIGAVAGCTLTGCTPMGVNDLEVAIYGDLLISIVFAIDMMFVLSRRDDWLIYSNEDRRKL